LLPKLARQLSSTGSGDHLECYVSVSGHGKSNHNNLVTQKSRPSFCDSKSRCRVSQSILSTFSTLSFALWIHSFIASPTSVPLYRSLVALVGIRVFESRESPDSASGEFHQRAHSCPLAHAGAEVQAVSNETRVNRSV